ncbi:MAG TPA: glutathione S-transferase [Burkholderiales bacterium]|jgi:glutathione S-transferase|nr:glutathione S-transferase [Burkholderiales bacterium]
MKLIGTPASPYVRKVRIVMAEKKIDFEHVIESPWAPDTKVPQSNPLGKIPCLVMEDGGAVFDSRVIVEYLDTINPVNKLIPASGRARVEVRCWEALGDGICDAAILARLETQRPKAQQSASWVARQMGKVEQGLAAAARGLGDKPWCAGNTFTLADIATGTALGYLDFRFPQIEWRTTYPHLVKLADKLATRPSFADTVPVA